MEGRGKGREMIFDLVFIILIQILACACIHAIKMTDVPTSIWGFTKLLFLPYVLYLLLIGELGNGEE